MGRRGHTRGCRVAVAELLVVRPFDAFFDNDQKTHTIITMKTTTREIITELYMLEVTMFNFYHEMKLAARAASQSETELEANRLAAEELHDGLTILKFLRAEHTENEVAELLNDQARGQFLTRAENPPSEKLIPVFARRVRENGDLEIADWLDDVAREERRHEATVHRMGTRLQPAPVAPKPFKREQQEEMLPLGTRYFMTLDASDFTTGFSAFQRLADSAEVVSNPRERVIRNVGIANYTYQPW